MGKGQNLSFGGLNPMRLKLTLEDPVTQVFCPASHYRQTCWGLPSGGETLGFTTWQHIFILQEYFGNTKYLQ